MTKPNTQRKFWEALKVSPARIVIKNKSGDKPEIKAMPITPDILEEVKTVLGFSKIKGGYIVDMGRAAFYISNRELSERYEIISR